MYVHRLIEFAEKHPSLFPPLGFRKKKYQWIVDVTKRGFQFTPAVKGDELVLPDVSRASNVKPILLVDKADYVFGFSDTKKNNERSKERHIAYMKLLEAYLEKFENEDIKLVWNFLRQPVVLPDKIKISDFIAFRIRDDEWLHDSSTFQQFWSKYVKSTAEDGDAMQCMFCGEIGPIMKRHTIDFLIGPERTKLISANANAYESHGLKYSYSAPTCYECEQKYGQALQHLLQRYSDKKKSGGPHTFRLNDLTYIYWIRGIEQLNGLNALLSSAMERSPKEMEEMIKDTFKGIKKERSFKNFCLLTVSANKARLVVRDYEENSAEILQRNIERFFNAQNVGADRYYGVYTLAATMYQKASTQMQKFAINEWMNWLLKGRPLSAQVLLPILKQIQSKGKMYPQEGAAIKSWLVSQSNQEGREWTVAVDQQNTNPAYLCGRLFAVLEKIQQDATKVKSTISEKFFGAASTTPRSVMGLLIRNAQNHLSSIRKKDQGKAIYLDQRITNILADVKSYPATLSLPEQAEFALGYYQEKQDLYTSKKDKEGEK